MIDNYPGSYPINDKTKKDLLKHAVIVFDADTLKSITDLPDNVFNELISLLKASKVEKRLWIPYNVDYKYHKDLMPTIDNKRLKVAELFTKDKIGIAFNKAQYAYLYKRGQERFDKQMPPGMMGGGNDKKIIYHDYLIWKEMQAYAGDNKKDIILVKYKIDYAWFEKEGDNIYTNHTISNEFYSQTKHDFDLKRGRLFLAYSITDFLELCVSNLDGKEQGNYDDLLENFVSIKNFQQRFHNTSDENDDKSDDSSKSPSKEHLCKYSISNFIASLIDKFR